MTDIEAIEEKLFSDLTAEPPPVDGMVEKLKQMYSEGGRDRALEMRELVEESLQDKKDADGLLREVTLTADWDSDDKQRKQQVADMLLRVFRRSRRDEFVKNAGFDKDVPLEECLRRVNLLNELSEGVLCLDRGWGFGVVRGVDTFYRKIRVDFEGKPGHEVSFNHAAESFELLGEGHLLAVRHSSPEEFDEMVRNRPGEVVKLALESYGSMPVAVLKEVLEEAGIADSQWKDFWSRARQQLKSDSLVEIPSKRTECLVLRNSVEELQKDWQQRIESARDALDLCVLAEEMVQTLDSMALEGAMLGRVRERFRELLENGFQMTPELRARVLGTMARLGFEWDAEEREIFRNILNTRDLPRVLEALPARISSGLLKEGAEVDPASLYDVLFCSMKLFKRGAFVEAMKFLETQNMADEAVRRMGEDMREGLQTPEMLHWLAQNVEPERLRELIDPGDFVARVIAAISDTTGGGDGDKSRELLKSLFTSDESITRIFSMLTAVQRRDVLSRLSDIRAWDPVERRSVVARVVRRFPELKQSMEAARSADGEEKSNRLTSWRTYNERREKLRRLVEVEIPQNSREIGVARSYGDLRENHEYKAAKEHQGILMRRKAEYERDLAEVKGTSFEEATPETAGMGVRIEIERPDGKVQEFSILGEWDSDEKLGIVSSESLIAKSVLGLRAGDQVELPAVDGREGQLENCTVKRILPLSQQVRDWIAERAPAG